MNARITCATAARNERTGAAVTAPAQDVADVVTPTPPDYPETGQPGKRRMRGEPAIRVRGEPAISAQGPMTGTLFETPERGGNIWRLQVVTYNGKVRADWRQYFRRSDGQWQATKAGTSMPIESLTTIRVRIGAWEAGNVLSGPENGS